MEKLVWMTVGISWTCLRVSAPILQAPEVSGLELSFLCAVETAVVSSFSPVISVEDAFAGAGDPTVPS